MSMTKQQCMELLGMTRGVDTALPHHWVQEVVAHLGCDYHEVTGNFVCDYRTTHWGQFVPITLQGVNLMHRINEIMGYNIPTPQYVVDVTRGCVVTVAE